MQQIKIILSIILCLFPFTAIAADWIPMTSGTTSNLSSVWGASASDVFAVGASGTILHYNGSAWSVMASGTTENLKGVWGSSGNDVFAVGINGTILRYDGTSWNSMTSGTTNQLNGVWGNSSSDVIAVGDCMTIIHFDGTAWSAMIESCCDGDYYCYEFNSVWGSSGTDVYAVGRGYKTECLNHYDGTNWQCSGTPYGWNNAIWGSSSADIFSAGIWIWHYNGNGWTRLQPNFSGHYYYGIWGASAHDVFFAGTEGYITHYNGTSFSPMTSGVTNQLNGVWGSSSSDVFAVGAGGTILHYDGHIITPTTTTVLTTTTSIRTSTTTVPPSTTTVFSTTTVPPTLVTLIDFHAVNGSSSVTLVWSTASEIDTAGYNLYRAEAENGNFIKINNSLIPAQGTSTQGANYEFIDTNVQNRKTYYYKLEDIDLNGVSTFHGPASATPRLLYGIR
jgi:hypothetical protein